MNWILNNGTTDGYRINRKIVSLIQLRKMVYVSNEVVDIGLTYLRGLEVAELKEEDMPMI